MSSVSRSLSQNNPKTPSKLSKSVTARSKSNSSPSRLPPPPPALLPPPPPSFTSTKKPPKEKESYISTGPRSIFSIDNPRGFLEFIDSEHGLVQISMILNDGKIKTFKVVKNKLIITDEKFLGQTVESVRENNIKMLEQLGIKHPQYKGKYGGKKTRKHRKTKGKKYYKKRTLRKRK
jgi:hypothetical protein